MEVMSVCGISITGPEFLDKVFLNYVRCILCIKTICMANAEGIF